MSTYRDDREALQHRADAVAREAEQLRAENAAIREMVGKEQGFLLPTSLPPGAVYRMDIRALPLAERARLAAHTVRPFPVWAAGLLNIVTLGLFSLIHFGLQHDRLPRAAHNDPSAGKAIGFQFIPYYNLYWIFFNSMRLCDRLTLQLRLRGRTDKAPRGLMIAACIVTVIPYLGLLALPILWTVVACMLQATVNKVAALSPTEWDATPSPYDQPGQTSSPVPLPYDSPRAKRLVFWSNLLGWGGLAFVFVGPFIGSAIAGAGGAYGVGAIAFVVMLVGAVMGQIGRGMQGRAI